MIKRRIVIPLIVLFGAVILILTYSGIESSRKNMLKLLTGEGVALMDALLTMAQNNVASSAIVEEATNERLLDIAVMLSGLIELNPEYSDSLEVLERRYRLERIDIIDQEGQIILSSWQEMVGEMISAEDEQFVVVDSILSHHKDISIYIPLPTVIPEDNNLMVAVLTRVGIVTLKAETKNLTDYQQSLGIGYVLRQLGAQEGVDYVVLQSDEGIILASRQIDKMVSIETDKFLTDALTENQTMHRIHHFEDKEVLELVHAFRSDVLPSGLFRMALSLDSYHELHRNSLKQLAIISIVLFILGAAVLYAVISSKKLQTTTSSLQQLKSVTDEIIESVEAAIVAINRKSEITIFNPQAAKIFSLAGKAIVGKKYRELFDDDKLYLEKIRQEANKVQRGEIVIKSAGNQQHHLLISATPIHSPDGGYSGAVALIYDISELKKLEENARMSERLSELGNLAAGVAHEIRNPLNSISIATQRLGAEFLPATDQEEYKLFLKTISEEVDRLNTIIKDFLALARGGELKKVLVDLNEYLSELVSLVRLEAESKKIRITLKIKKNLKAQLDKQEMKKVIHNLVRNAIEASTAGNEIIIAAAENPEGGIEIDISNDGEIIPDELRQKIFQPYFTSKAEGTGLGLPICHRIIRDHNGTLELLDGSPTTFRIRI